MIENFAVISGTIDSDKNLKYITETAKNRYSQYTTAHHEWIDSVEESEYRKALNQVRIDPKILDKIKEKFPNSSIKSVTEADEIYWAVSPKGATGSDRSLVDCHYDSPFAIIPTGGVIFYRVIIACNENKTVTTVFPDEKISVRMNTKDFHGLDYNKDIHCVEGSIPENKFRVLLKMHYIITPYGSEQYEYPIRAINVFWTQFSRETMRMSANPKYPHEYIVSFIVNFCRVVFNNIYIILLILIIALVFFKKTLFNMKKLKNFFRF